MSKLLGRHLIVELFGCDRARLDDEEFLRACSVAAAAAMRATVVAVHVHRFQPVGVSVVVMLSESHLALHTWPEQGMASLDIFVCSPLPDPVIARDHITDSLRAARTAQIEFDCGKMEDACTHRWHRVKPAASSSGFVGQ